MTHRATTLLTALILAVFAFGLPSTAQAVSCYPQIAPSTPDEDFQIMANGSALHRPTGLVWMRCNLGQTWNGTTCTGSPATFTSWEVGMRTARDINTGASDLDGDGMPGFAGYNDWRVPSIKEWRSIHEVCRHAPALNDAVFPNAPLSTTHYSSTSDHQSPAVTWGFDSRFGNTGVIPKSEGIPRMMRLVRGGHGGGEYIGTGRLFANGFE